MSDTNQATDDAGAAATEFDAEFNAFLGQTFGDDFSQDDEDHATSGDDTSTASTGEETQTAPAGDDTLSATSGNETQVSPNGAGDGQQASGDDTIDPALLADMLGLGGPGAGTETQSAPAGQSTETSTTSADGEDFMPFQPTFELPPAVVQGLFEAEDSETRAKSLVGLLSAFGNSITQTVMKEAGRRTQAAITAYVAGQNTENVSRAVNTHFYGANPDLKPYMSAVQRAFKVIADRNPDAAYSEETAKQVANLARASLKQAGVTFAAPATVAPKEIKKIPPGKAPGSAFEAGGARSGSGLTDNGDSGPADLVAQFSEF